MKVLSPHVYPWRELLTLEPWHTIHNFLSLLLYLETLDLQIEVWLDKKDERELLNTNAFICRIQSSAILAVLLILVEWSLCSPLNKTGVEGVGKGDCGFLPLFESVKKWTIFLRSFNSYLLIFLFFFIVNWIFVIFLCIKPFCFLRYLMTRFSIVHCNLKPKNYKFFFFNRS